MQPLSISPHENISYQQTDVCEIPGFQNPKHYARYLPSTRHGSLASLPLAARRNRPRSIPAIIDRHRRAYRGGGHPSWKHPFAPEQAAAEGPRNHNPVHQDLDGKYPCWCLSIHTIDPNPSTRIPPYLSQTQLSLLFPVLFRTGDNNPLRIHKPGQIHIHRMQAPRNLTRELPPAMSTIRPLTTMALQTTRTTTPAFLRTGDAVSPPRGQTPARWWSLQSFCLLVRCLNWSRS
ncbi:hypothetical protein KC333_g3 [Hortaea werneckii]|nr:hypothetical protein KC333_g3 [Hortaea werneckii]